jgi:integrase
MSTGSGSLTVRGTTWSLRYYHDGAQLGESARIPVTCGCTPGRVAATPCDRNHKRAARLLAMRTAEARTPAFVPPAASRVRFDDLVALLKADYARKGRKTAARLDHPGGAVGHLRGFFTGRMVEVDALAVEAYVAHRQGEQAKPATINRELAALRRMCKLGVAKRLLPVAPIVETLPEHNVRKGFTDPADFARLHAELARRDPTVADAALVAYETGLRRGNVLGMRWSWVTLERDATGAIVAGRITIPGEHMKNGRAWSLPLATFDGVLAVLARRHQDRDDLRSPFVFTRNGRRLEWFRGTWQQATRAAGMPALRWHDFRRSTIRNLVRAGVREAVAMKVSGHLTRHVFDRYNITSDEDLAAAGTALQSYVAAQVGDAPKVVPLRTGS